MQLGYQLAGHASLPTPPSGVGPYVLDASQYITGGIREGQWSLTDNGSSVGGLNDSSTEDPEDHTTFNETHDFHVDTVIAPSGEYTQHHLSTSMSLTRMRMSRSSSPSDEDGASRTSSITVMKTQAFGGLRRSRRSQKPPVDPNRYNAAMQVIDGYSLGLSATDQPSRKRARFEDDEEYFRLEGYTSRVI